LEERAKKRRRGEGRRGIAPLITSPKTLLVRLQLGLCLGSAGELTMLIMPQTAWIAVEQRKYLLAFPTLFCCLVLSPLLCCYYNHWEVVVLVVVIIVSSKLCTTVQH